MTKYNELREKHQKEVNDFPIGFAFSDKQFEEQMQKLGLDPDDTSKVISIGGGGFIRKTDLKAFEEGTNYYLLVRASKYLFRYLSLSFELYCIFVVQYCDSVVQFLYICTTLNNGML